MSFGVGNDVLKKRGTMDNWQEKAKDLKFQQGKSWGMVTQELKQLFPDNTDKEVHDKIRSYLRAQPEYKKKESTVRSSVEFKADGTMISDRIIEISENEDMTPDFLMKAHGLDNTKWEVISYKNNLWHSQVKGGTRLVMYQSKITVKPRRNTVSELDIDRMLENKRFKYDKPLTKAINYNIDGEVLEICLPDLHSGLLSWRMETGLDYDIHIAKDHFFKGIYDIIQRCGDKKFSKIILVTLGDILHIDNDKQETTKGTFQQADGRFNKIFDSTLDMLIDGITLLANISKIEVIYLPGNHDKITGYTLLKSTEMAFRNDDNVTFDTGPNPQKFRLIGNALIGWTHGDMPPKNMSSWLQQRARKEFGESIFAEVHAGHFHSNKTKEYKQITIDQTIEENGVVVKYLPSLCNASYWEHQQGYSNGTKTIISFIWNVKTGLREMWYSNI